MKTHLKIKNNDNYIDAYINYMTCKSELLLNELTNVKIKSIKMNNDNIIIPTIQNFNDITNYNYNLNQLKLFAKHYKLKINGNKHELLIRIFSFLYFSSYIIKIQKNFRRHIVEKYKKLHGPAVINRKLCTNTNDFITLEPIEDICFNQFISYNDDDGFIYGFDIVSIYNLFLKGSNVQNPYNRNFIPNKVLKDIKSILKLNKILKININLNYEDDSKNVSNEKAVELQALSLFQTIDSLGNYSDAKWFLSLNKIKLIIFIRELQDIWNYRAQISTEIKRNICPPFGDPFRYLSLNYLNEQANILTIKKSILNVLEKMVNTGIDKDSKSLGAYYILGALTLVNMEAAESLPWLFQCFHLF